MFGQDMESQARLIFFLVQNKDDLIDCIGVGVEINGKQIRALLYADDIAILGINPKVLQNINNKVEYNCILNCGIFKIIYSNLKSWH